MCCIFTCCAWMIDLVQRAWVFAMSCCISSAVCCVILISSMSGVALGYNYSLAEYIDLKETNVSIYLKRGVFDDDVTDDMEWRRSGGHEAVRGFARDDGDLMTGAPDNENVPLKSGRRLDDSILESDDHNKFEGSLMRLTAKPVHPLTTTPPVTSDDQMHEIFSQYPQGSLDQLKAIQSLISMRKAAAARATTTKGSEGSTYGQDERYVPHFPMFPDSRRMGGGPALAPPRPEGYGPAEVNPARFAVPDSSINERSKWMLPKHPDLRKGMDYNDDHRTYPSPVTYRAGPIRPTRPEQMVPTHSTTEEAFTMRPVQPGRGVMDREMERFKEKLILDKYEAPRQQEDRQKEPKPGFEYYEDDIKGLPVRRKRNINRIKRKVPKAVHQKIHESASAKSKGNRITNKINNYPSVSVSTLFRASSESLKSKMDVVSENDINSTTDRIVKIIQSMFS